MYIAGLALYHQNLQTLKEKLESLDSMVSTASG